MTALPAVGMASQTELPAALALIFHHLDADDRKARSAHLLELIEQKAIDPCGIWVARKGAELSGAMICQPLAGAGGLVWPPQGCRGRDGRAIEDQLVQATSQWLRSRGVKLAQALLVSSDMHLGAALVRNGYEHISSLMYLRHELELSAAFLGTPERLHFDAYGPETQAVFHQTLMRSYVGTLDCPEINGVRTLDEILAGHRAQGVPDSHRWWLARDGDRPAGVLLMTAWHEGQGWDISYLGVVPELRGRGFGNDLVRKALFEAKAAQTWQVTLSVDIRNQPAWDLYLRAGFESFERREIFLIVWERSGAADTSALRL